MSNTLFVVAAALVAGFLNLIVTGLAISYISEKVSLYFSAPLMVMLYVVILAISSYFWLSLAVIVTILIWCMALYIYWVEWHREKLANNKVVKTKGNSNTNGD